MRCKRLIIYHPPVAINFWEYYSERGVRSAADLLPEYYEGGDKDNE